MCSRQRDHSVAEHSKAVTPRGQPISHSTKFGLSRGREVGAAFDDAAPAVEVVGAGRPERAT